MTYIKKGRTITLKRKNRIDAMTQLYYHAQVTIVIRESEVYHG
jgi:hypothetical protein